MSTRPLTVLAVLDSLAPGGTETSTVAVAPLLAEHGVDLTIVTLRHVPSPLHDTAAANGTRVIALASRGRLGRARELRRLVRSLRPDVVHTALFEADIVGRVAAAGTGATTVSSFVNTPYVAARLSDPHVTRWKLRLVQLIDAATLRLLVDVVHSVSEGAKQANCTALHVPERKVMVVERGRDAATLGVGSPERSSRVREALDIAPDATVLLNVGRLEHQKGQNELIRAMGLVVRSVPDAVLLIAGKDGAAKAEIERALAADPRVASHVRLLGHRDDVPDLLAAADLLVISSHFEGTAGVALEAMAIGTPTVSTDLDGLRGILDHDRNAHIVASPQPEHLAEGINRLLADPDRAQRLADRAADDFRERFTLEQSARRLAEMYRVLAGH